MPELTPGAAFNPPSAELVAQRWEYALAQYEQWTQIWAAKPALSEKAGERLRQLMTPLDELHRQQQSGHWIF